MKRVSPTFCCKMRCNKLETPCTNQAMEYIKIKTGVGANKKSLKWKEFNNLQLN